MTLQLVLSQGGFTKFENGPSPVSTAVRIVLEVTCQGVSLFRAVLCDAVY